jgi:hypothetical protein
MRTKKLRPIIAEDDMPAIFDDACVAELAKIAQLPSNANLAVFAAGIREAARIFVRDARVPTNNELHDEIAKLHSAAERRRYEQVVTRLEGLSQRAKNMLIERADRISRKNVDVAPYPRVTAIGRHGEVLSRKPTAPLMVALPSPDRLHDRALRDRACEEIARLCAIGGKYIEGRERPGGKKSHPVWHPMPYAPEKQRNFPRRNAERHFVMMLSTAWVETVGALPARTARHGDASRGVGPFARLVRKCLDLVGAGDADAVELINEVDRRRDEMERRSGEREQK